jgi:acetyl-CoA carboxylase biotin carboxyl carrier protein
MIPASPQTDGDSMGSSDLEAIRRVVAAFERSDWAEIDVRAGSVRVHLAAGHPSDPAVARPSSGAGRLIDQRAATGPTPAVEPRGLDLASLPPGTHVVVSPSPGICWRSPEPGAPHFVDLGDEIDESATLCIVEVMKLMSHLKAGVGGRVVAVYGENGVAVDQGQPLFAIAPTGSVS